MAVELFFMFLIAGLLLVGAEIFVPGGILGIMGGLALLGAIIAGFVAFRGYGGWIAFSIVFLVGIAMFLWIKIFPNTRIGRRMTVSTDLAASKGTQSGLQELMGRQGTALSSLRPSGFARIDGKRVDVITQGEMLSKGDTVVVVDVESNRVVVRGVETKGS